MKKLLDVSIAALVEAADEYGLEVIEQTTRGRGRCRDVMLVDDTGHTLAELRVYEKVVQILNARKWGAPPRSSHYQVNPNEHWTRHMDSPAEFKREIEWLVLYYINRREGKYETEDRTDRPNTNLNRVDY